MQQINHSFGEYLFSSDPSLMQWDQIHHWLANEAYWSKDIPFDTVRSAGENAFCIGVFYLGTQIGYARIITDYTTFGYLADVYILEEHRGRGLSKAMMHSIMELGWVKGLRRFLLATRDAHGLYRQYGFEPIAIPDRFMEINQPDIYQKKNPA
ncbi:MAG TPA: GNAT family N-acetyltransferase [Sediminibacterium sp.]|nr:GNAT family N-acetyltransferase [Sediminibacterium sp.]